MAIYPSELSRDDTMARLISNYDPDLENRLLAGDTSILAASWGPYVDPRLRSPGLWMSFYTGAAVHYGDIFNGDMAAAQRAGNSLPRLTVDNETALAWLKPGHGSDHQLRGGANGPVDWTRLVFAAFQLATQANLAHAEPVSLTRAERRRNQRARLSDRDVRLIRLRSSIVAARDSDEPANAPAGWHHRWVVRGHWRKQCYPSLHDHRPTWIAPYVKGPADAPLLGGEKVQVIVAGSDPTDEDEPGHVNK
jgi:hypothetical protein